MSERFCELCNIMYDDEIGSCNCNIEDLQGLVLHWKKEWEARDKRSERQYEIIQELKRERAEILKMVTEKRDSLRNFLRVNSQYSNDHRPTLEFIETLIKKLEP